MTSKQKIILSVAIFITVMTLCISQGDINLNNIVKILILNSMFI